MGFIDRRLCRRYPIELDLKYKVLEGDAVISRGSGKTCDLSSRGLSFRADTSLRAGMLVKLNIDWPFLMQDACPVALVVMGHVVRAQSGAAGVRIMTHEFRRHGLRRFDSIVAAPRAGSGAFTAAAR